MKKVYLAGPMRGFPNWNKSMFLEAEEGLVRLGFRVFNPWRIAEGLGYMEHDKAEPDCQEGRIHLEHVMLSDCLCLSQCDAICLLPDWWNSRGVAVELAMAQFLGLQQMGYRNGCFYWLSIMQTPWKGTEAVILDYVTHD